MPWRSMLDLLQEKRSDLADAVDAVNRAIAAEEEDAGLWRVAFILAQAALFSESGMVTEELWAFYERCTRAVGGFIHWI